MKKIIVIAIIFLASCSQAPEPEVKKEPVVKKTMSKDNVFKGYKDATDKAKAAEKDIMDAAERQKKAIDDM